MSESPDRTHLERIDTAGGRSVYYDESAGTYHTWCDQRQYEPVSTALSFTVASVLGVEPTDLDALTSAVDPDALNAIFVHWHGDEPRIGDGRVSFTYAGCAITLSSDGELVIDPGRTVPN